MNGHFVQKVWNKSTAGFINFISMTECQTVYPVTLLKEFVPIAKWVQYVKYAHKIFVIWCFATN